MRIECVSVASFGLPATGELLTRAFADYFVKIVLSEAALRGMVGTDSVDLSASLVALVDGEPAGAALVARRGSRSRVAGMALVPALRRHGAGRFLMQAVLTQARQRGDERVVLEVIADNAPAVALYENLGFRRLRRLLGFATTQPLAAAAADTPVVESVSLREAGEALARLHDADWPWQISGATIAALESPNVAYRSGGVWLALSDPSQPTVTIRGLGAERGTAAADIAGVLRAVMQRHPGRHWRASAIWPEEHSDWFTEAGLERTPLSQWQMDFDLNRGEEPTR